MCIVLQMSSFFGKYIKTYSRLCQNIELSKIPKKVIMNLPSYLPHIVLTNFPQNIREKYHIVKDLNINSKTKPSFYYKIIDTIDRRPYFMKISIENALMRNEIIIYDKINNLHDNIVKLVYKYHDDNFTILIMPWYKDDLFSIMAIPNITEQQIKNIMKKLINTLIFMISKGIIYTDLKCENILVDNNFNPIITDMDMYILMEDNYTNLIYKTNHSVCTKAYGTPETLMERIYSEKTISWKLGIILYNLIAISNEPLPFDVDAYMKNIAFGYVHVDNYYEEAKNYLNKPIYRSIKYNDDIDDILFKMLDPNYHTRISLFDISKHSWFNKNDR